MVFLAHPPDQVTQASVDFRPHYPLPRFPTPKGPEASPMPANYRLRFHHLDHFEKVRPQPNHPSQDCPIHAVQSQSAWYPPQRNVQLMTEQHILSFKPPARLEKVHHYDHNGA